MKILQRLNITAIIAVLWAFCFVNALSFDGTGALRGRSNGNGRNLQYKKVEVFRCDAENRTIASTITNKTEDVEEEGLDIRVCFRVTPTASSDDLAILKIDDFSFTKDRVNGDLAAAGPTRQIPAIMRQNAVDHGVAMSTDFTKIYCDPGADICALETRLTGYFFLTNGMIKARGKVAMQRGRYEGRELQQLDGFEDVAMDLEFTGGGRNAIPPETRTILIILGIIIGLLLLCCMCGFACCIFGVCCFAYRNKKDTEEPEESIEEVSVKIEFDPALSKKSKKRDEDESETESLEDDKYWDDEAGMSDDESVDGNVSEGNSVEGFDNEINGAAVDPVSETDEESLKKESKRKSKRNKSMEDNDSWVDNSEDGIEPVDRSAENLDVENNMEEIVPVEDAEEEVPPVEETEEEPPKKKKSKKKKRSKIID